MRIAARTMALVACLLAAPLLLVGCGGDGDSNATDETAEATVDPASADSITVELREFSDSGQSGIAVLTTTSDDLNVKIEVNNAQQILQHGSLYRGTCNEPEPGPYAFVEKDQRDGTFEGVDLEAVETEEPPTLEDLQSGDYVVTVTNDHRDVVELGSDRFDELGSEGYRFVTDGESAFPLTACGEIPGP